MFVGRGKIVTATRCDFTKNGHFGVYCRGANTKVRFNNCTMHHNSAGLGAFESAVVDLHGTKTDIYSNKGYGIVAKDNG